jgi:hypothetical protein
MAQPPLEALAAVGAFRLNVDGYAKAVAARGAAWKSPAVWAPGRPRPGKGSLEELLLFDAEPLPCPLVKLLTPEGAAKARVNHLCCCV